MQTKQNHQSMLLPTHVALRVMYHLLDLALKSTVKTVKKIFYIYQLNRVIQTAFPPQTASPPQTVGT